MKRDFPLYEGDGFIRNPAVAEASLLEDTGKTAFAGPSVDFADIEKRARRTRAVTLWGMFERLFDRIDASIGRAKYRELERYLGESTDLADLERRLRRMGHERRNMFAQG